MIFRSVEVDDESFDLAARGAGLTTEAHPGDRDRLGKRTGPIRNGEVVAPRAGLCAALHRFLPGSKGTKCCCRRAIEAGIPT